MFLSPAIVGLFTFLLSLILPYNAMFPGLFLCFLSSFLFAAATPFFVLSWKKVSVGIVFTLFIWGFLVIELVTIFFGLLYFSIRNMGPCG